MGSQELCWWPATELALKIRTKAISPVEVVEALLARIESINPTLNAYCMVTADLARGQARAAEAAVMRGERLGPLHGVPVSIKDLIFTKGIRTTYGSRVFSEFIPDQDAVVVERLLGVGAIVVGKTTTPEFGHKGVTDSPLLGVTRNPWKLDRTPGGSSGGAGAAVAAGLGPLAVGTDGGGSIRIPASFCGVYGLKPSFGRVPRGPGFPGWEFFSTVCPMTRTVRDAALMLDVIAGPDNRDPASLPASGLSYMNAVEGEVRGLRCAWSPDFGYAAVEPEVLEICRQAIAVFGRLGAKVDQVKFVIDSPEEPFNVMAAAETATTWGHLLPEWEGKLDPGFISFVKLGMGVSAAAYVKAMQTRKKVWNQMEQLFRHYDLLLTPTVAVPPFAAGTPGPTEIAGRDVTPGIGWIPFTYPLNMTGHPAASVPAGFTPDGLPVGLQLVGRRWADDSVLRASRAFEEAQPWAHLRPELDRG
jgi:Asp-tRNA(Asn)/Glu-tRNA(Gln) amidotransferase A subunit family amidase